MLTLYAFKTSDGRFMATMDKNYLSGKEGKGICLGAVVPGRDGNYYQDLELATQLTKGDYLLGAQGHLKWLIESIDVSAYEICDDPQFSFELKDITICTLVEQDSD